MKYSSLLDFLGLPADNKKACSPLEFVRNRSITSGPNQDQREAVSDRTRGRSRSSKRFVMRRISGKIAENDFGSLGDTSALAPPAWWMS